MYVSIWDWSALLRDAGLAQVDDQIGKLSSHVLDRRLVQVVMARTSDLLGKSIRETRFRRRFDAAIIALHREGQRIREKIGDITLSVCCHHCHMWDVSFAADVGLDPQTLLMKLSTSSSSHCEQSLNSSRPSCYLLCCRLGMYCF